jgi:thiol-disulfide isomerase/thioredoxin
MNFMKKFLLLAVMLYTIAATQAQPKVSGKIPDSPYEKIFLYEHKGYKVNKISTAILDPEGKFYFTIPLEIPIHKGFYRIAFNDSVYSDFVLSPDDKSIVLQTSFYRMQEGLKIKNRENEAMAKIMDFQSDYADRIAELKEKYVRVMPTDSMRDEKRRAIMEEYAMLQALQNDLLRKFISENAGTFVSYLAGMEIVPLLAERPDLKDKYRDENEFLRDHFFDNIDFSAPQLMYGASIFDKFMLYMQQYVPKNLPAFQAALDSIIAKTSVNSSLHSATIKFFMEIFELRGPEEMFLYVVDKYSDACSMDEEYKDVKENRETILNLMSGKPAPFVTMPDTSGALVRLDSIIARNKATLVMFWASWCDHCREEVPTIVQLYRKYWVKGLEIYAVCLDTKKEDMMQFIRDNRFNCIQVCDFKQWKSDAALKYYIKRTPQYYLIGKDGLIVGKNMSMHVLEERIMHLLGIDHQH